MVTDQQVRRLFMLIQKENGKTVSATKAGMDPKTALKYRKSEQMPSQMATPHTWRTREDPFCKDWPQIQEMIEINPGLEAKTIFEYLQREDPGTYQDGQLRTLQRRIKRWRATEGPAKEVYFPQVHHPGELCASDFTHMKSLGVRIGKQAFDHLMYHFVLTYSNWETVRICFSESFESLSAGLQHAFWELGGVPRRHRSDRMSAAVNKDCHPEKFNRRYQDLLNHYGLTPERTNAGKGHENGDAEQSHHRLKRAIEQALLLRGSRDFADRQEYEAFIARVLAQKNAGRRQRLDEELVLLRKLPVRKTSDHTRVQKRVTPSSTVHIQNNVYSVHSRLIGERVQVRLYVDHLEIWYARQLIESMPRLRGRSKQHVQYRHIIDWLVRKPGAFAGYRYQSEMFPSSHFRVAYDELRSRMPLQSDREYLRILKIAAGEGEASTERALQDLLARQEGITAEKVRDVIERTRGQRSTRDVYVELPSLSDYDALLTPCSRQAVAHG